MSRTNLPTKNYHEGERGPGQVTDFDILGPPAYLGSGWRYGLEI